MVCLKHESYIFQAIWLIQYSQFIWRIKIYNKILTQCTTKYFSEQFVQYRYFLELLLFGQFALVIHITVYQQSTIIIGYAIAIYKSKWTNISPNSKWAISCSFIIIHISHIHILKIEWMKYYTISHVFLVFYFYVYDRHDARTHIWLL